MRFVAFEGLDGAGKSTLIHGLKQELEARRLQAVMTREPGGSGLGDEIRELLLRVDGEAPVPRAEALLYQAVRAQHVEKLIRPSLKDGKWVLCDRFAASSLAFQGGGRSIQTEDIRWLNHFSTTGLEPDLYILLDLPVDESIRRLVKREQDRDRFEREKKDFHERVRATFLSEASRDAARWLVLNAEQGPEVLLKTVLQYLESKKWLT
ncbi:MAG: dTMP kinase [Bdellovibrionales bacterium]